MAKHKISILHISDLHFGNSQHDHSLDGLAINIANDLRDNNNPIDKIIVSGDIVDGKIADKEREYEKAGEFFNSLEEKLNQKFKTTIGKKGGVVDLFLGCENPLINNAG